MQVVHVQTVGGDHQAELNRVLRTFRDGWRITHVAHSHDHHHGSMRWSTVMVLELDPSYGLRAVA